MEKREFNKALIGFWLITAPIILIIAFLASKLERLQWLPLGEMYNFYYILILGMSVVLYISINELFQTSFVKLISNLVLWTIFISLLMGVGFAIDVNYWTGSVSDRPPSKFNFHLATIIGIGGLCIIVIIIGFKLISKKNS